MTDTYCPRCDLPADHPTEADCIIDLKAKLATRRPISFYSTVSPAVPNYECR